MIKSSGFAGWYRLVDDNNIDIKTGQVSGGWTVTGGAAPKHPGSSGRVWMQNSSGADQEFFPHVFDWKWVLQQ